MATSRVNINIQTSGFACLIVCPHKTSVVDAIVKKNIIGKDQNKHIKIVFPLSLQHNLKASEFVFALPWNRNMTMHSYVVFAADIWFERLWS